MVPSHHRIYFTKYGRINKKEKNMCNNMILFLLNNNHPQNPTICVTLYEYGEKVQKDTDCNVNMSCLGKAGSGMGVLMWQNGV